MYRFKHFLDKLGIHAAERTLRAAFFENLVIASRLQNRHIVFLFVGADFTGYTHPFGQFLDKVIVAFVNLLTQFAEVFGALCLLADNEQVENVVQYIRRNLLGATTPSYDLEHEIDATYPTEHITRELVEETLKTFIGEIQQVPPAFSACMVNGKRAYDLARKGEEVELKPKLLVIDEIELLECNLPEIKVRVVCSKGTYIRALARDIGEALNSGAHLTALERTRVGDVRLEDCLDPMNFKEWIDAQEIEIEE